MKQGNLKKKVRAILLAVTMMVTSFPQISKEAYAAGNELPTIKQFAAKEELKSFNTDDTNDKVTNSAKVYFGKENQQWWIVGSQNGNLTLFAASPLAVKQAFSKGSSQKYDADWGCTYQNSVPEKVSANHYGASPLRNTLKELETSYFTDEEQSLMNHTTIYTDDMKNGSVYSTTNKLYLAYGEVESEYITVGANSADSLNGGLCVDQSYWGNISFWLRTPTIADNGSSAWPGSSVQSTYVFSKSNVVVPAFELNLSSVIFASAVPAAASEGSLAVDGNAMTLRYEDSNLGSAQVAFDRSTVNLKDVPADTYLVAQNSAGAWAKKVSGTTSVSASDMGSGFTGFENCKVWLEATNATERKTYAAMAAKEWHDVNIAENKTLNITSGNANQRVKIGDAVTDITVQANVGYYLPEGYLDGVFGLAGLTAVETDTGFTISGTPQNDVTITLPDATEKADRTDTPNVTGDVGMIKDTRTTMEYASSADSAAWKPCTDGSTKVSGGTWYVRYQETDTQKAGPAVEVTVTAPAYMISANPGSLTFDTRNEGYGVDGLSKTVTITNIGNSKVTLETPSGSNYNCTLSAAEVESGQSVTLTITPIEGLANGEYNETITVQASENTTEAVDVRFKVNGALQVSLSASPESIVEGQSATLTAAAQGGSGSYAYTWYENGVKNESLTGNEVTVSPTETTVYKVEAADTIENKSAAATITVTPKKYDLGVPADCAFENRHAGYDDVPAKGVKIQNTGNVDVTNINAALTGTNAAAFTLDTSGMQTTLAAAAETTVSVKPNAGLGAGTYQAELKITGDAGIQKSVPITFTVKEHEYEHEWKSDSTSHWHECTCGGKMDASTHTEDGGSVTKAPTETETGVRTYKCSVCGCVMRTEEIGKLPPTSTETPGQTEKPVSTEKMRENSAKLDSAVSVKWKGKALALKWTKIAGAEGYDVFAAQSGKKGSKATLAKTVENGKTSVSLAKIAGKKISGKEVYAVSIKAWKHVDGKKTYIGSSRTYHTAGSANKKYTNVKKLKLAKKKHTLKKGGSVRIQATAVKQSKKKKLLPKSYGAALRYQSGNEKIATVTQKGKVTAKKKGTCYIYVAALNGVRTKVKITVK